MKIKTSTTRILILLASLYSASSHAAIASATQHLRLIIPKVALIDTNNTHTPLVLSFDPIIEAGGNFPVATASSAYDISSNVRKLRLYAKINKDLKNDYNLVLRLNARSNTFKELTPTDKYIYTTSAQVRTDKKLNFEAAPAFTNKTIPHGNINVTVTYTLVEP